MRNDRFEWDDDKARANLVKHKVSFAAGCLVFNDPNSVEERDDDPHEDRYNVTGMVDDRLLTVNYAERAARIRIISARKANRREQAKYIGQV